MEGRVPLVSAKNRRYGIEELELQLAVRSDKYRIDASDNAIFGTDRRDSSCGYQSAGNPELNQSNSRAAVSPMWQI